MSVAAPLVALVGNPNAGKSSLFNALTGARQKIANYPGVTVERHSGRGRFADGRVIDFIDLPGTYSLMPSSPDEAVTHDVLMGTQAGERRPDAMIIVVDAGNLPHHLRFVLELLALGLPVIVALNMVDMAERDGLVLDAERLAQALGVPVVATVAVRRRGIESLLESLDIALNADAVTGIALCEPAQRPAVADKIARAAIVSESASRGWTRAIDDVLLHPIWGVLILLGILFVMFQAVFTLAQAPIDMLGGGVAALSDWIKAALLPSFWRDLVTEGAIAGVGAVITFLPQILILFFFILLLEASGYMARAAFLMDGLMAKVGLSGRGFIPLLSSFACAVPGIMATRAIADPKDRLTTILIAPLMTCSARLPVYAIIISAFIPARNVGPGIGLQGLVLFCLYLAGVIAALLAAWLLRRTVTRGANTSLLMELPRYQWPRFSDLLLGLWQRAIVFLRRAGTIIFATTIILWLLLSFPRVPADSTANQLDYSIGGHIASAVEVVVKPIGFNHDIAIALLPAMAAREVAVSALATAYAIEGSDDDATANRLQNRLSSRWSLATALAFLAWFVFAPQCISTIAVTRRETNGWKWPAFMVGYLFALAYGAAGATYWIAVAFGLG
ncbi:MAG: ferrous iron transporter B [Pseudomonadota bacterium]